MPYRSLRVLLVEEDGLIVAQIRRTLTNAGFEIADMAANGQEAVEMARRTQPDFILMDINMPVMNGIEATRYIMTERAIPIIILTGYDVPEYRDAAREAGACAYLVKPITNRELVKKIRECLFPGLTDAIVEKE